MQPVCHRRTIDTHTLLRLIIEAPTRPTDISDPRTVVSGLRVVGTDEVVAALDGAAADGNTLDRKTEKNHQGGNQCQEETGQVRPGWAR